MKTPLNLFIEKLDEIVSMKITDIDAFSKIVRDTKNYERQCIENAFEDGMSKVLEKLDVSIDSIWLHNYFNQNFE